LLIWEAINKLENILLKKLEVDNLVIAEHFPRYFEIETYRGCNAQCGMCFMDKMSNTNHQMSDKLYEKIINEAGTYSKLIEMFILARNGEPLLDSKLEQRIKLAKQNGMKLVSISTNASLLTEKRAKAIIESGLDDIRFSIDGMTKESFEKIRKGLKFKKVMENCLNFIKLRDQHGIKPIIQVRFVSQEDNQGQEEFFKDFWLSKLSSQDIAAVRKMHNWGGTLDSYSGNKVKKYAPIPCKSLWNSMVILADGTVPLCAMDYNAVEILGNANNSSLKEIWDSNKLKTLRYKHLHGKRNDIDMCKGCSVWENGTKKEYQLSRLKSKNLKN